MNAPVSTVLLRLLLATAATVGGVEGSKCRHNPSPGVSLSSNSLASATSSSVSIAATDSTTTSTDTDGTTASSTGTDSNTEGASSSSTTDSSTMTSMPDSLSSIVSSILDAKSSGVLTVTVQTGTSTGTDDGHITITLPTLTNTGDSTSTTASADDTLTNTDDSVSTTTSSGDATVNPSDGITASPTTPTSTGTDTLDSTSTAETETTPTTFNAADYTYYEVSLPVEFTTTLDGLATPTTTEYYSITNTPTPSCFIDASNQDQAFKISIKSGTQLIPKNGIIGALVSSDFPSQPPADFNPNTTPEDPAGAAANEAFYNTLPTFSFQETADGPKGFYDLVATVNEVTTYVALKRSTMEVRTTTHSTEGQTPDADGLITSIFSFSCDGRMVVSDLSGTVYIWKVAADGVSTEMVAGTPDADTEILLTPTTMPPGYDPAASIDPTLSKRHSRYASMPNVNILEARRSPYTDGQQARVPPYPRTCIRTNGTERET
ncbi:hypothetical protein PG993_013215 [Apiospora rasikravindrae]|uniref:Uncharacterized protein n=1 Tax=Apiospora rasikravindrae TaxID=990691 RepID=A0ABR1RXJ2_9PEZI